MTIFAALLAKKEAITLQMEQMDAKDLSTLVIESERTNRSNGEIRREVLSWICTILFQIAPNFSINTRTFENPKVFLDKQISCGWLIAKNYCCYKRLLLFPLILQLVLCCGFLLPFCSCNPTCLGSPVT